MKFVSPSFLLLLAVLGTLAMRPPALVFTNTNPPALTGLAESDLALNLGQDPLGLLFSAGQQMHQSSGKSSKGSYGANDIQVSYDQPDGKIVTVNAVVYGTRPTS